MNIAYLIWGERLTSPLIQGQVIDLLKCVSAACEKRIYLVSFQPCHILYHEKKQLAAIKKELGKSGITLLTIPILYRTKWFAAQWYQIPLIAVQAMPVLLYLGIAKKISLFHCRAYPVALPAILTTLATKAHVIFDPRSDYPEENITAGYWRKSSLSYNIWKKLEKFYLASSDVTVAISRTYIDHYKKLYEKARFSIIPNNVDTGLFVRDIEFRGAFRSMKGIGEDELILCYCGSLGQHWHNPDMYARYIIRCRGLKAKHRFLFITNDMADLSRSFKKNGIDGDEYILVSSRYADVPKYLSAADMGLVLMGDYKIALAVKTVEYLALGLPVITNANLASAAELIRDKGVGVIDSGDAPIGLLDKFLDDFLRHREQYSSQCRKIAENNFSTQTVSRQYADLYSALGA